MSFLTLSGAICMHAHLFQHIALFPKDIRKTLVMMYFRLLTLSKRYLFLMLIGHRHFQCVENIRYHVEAKNRFRPLKHEERIAMASVLSFYQLTNPKNE